MTQFHLLFKCNQCISKIIYVPRFIFHALLPPAPLYSTGHVHPSLLPVSINNPPMNIYLFVL